MTNIAGLFTNMRTAEFIPYHSINIYFDRTEDMHDIMNSFRLNDMFDFPREKVEHPCVHLIWGQLNE